MVGTKLAINQENITYSIEDGYGHRMHVPSVLVPVETAQDDGACDASGIFLTIQSLLPPPNHLQFITL
ncbi:hypothetical protein N7527_005401 [Penicillium freii]|nr:hypothetical protein N7527_005401 [Penicillium freii]